MNYWDAQELACQIMGLDYDTIVDEGREQEIDDKLYEKFEVDMEQFIGIADELLKLTPPIKSDLTGTLYNAFGVPEGQAWRAIAKRAISGTED